MPKFKKLFLLTFCLLVLYTLLYRVPVWPEMVWGYPYGKIIKSATGVAFCLGAFWIYRPRKNTV